MVVHTTDDDHSDTREDVRDRSTFAALNADPFATPEPNNVKSLKRSTDPISAGPFRTPHDDILAGLRGYSPLSAPPEQPLLRSDALQGSSLNPGSSAVETSAFTTESLPTQEPVKETMYDPFTGQKLYDYVPAPARSGADRELWSHLSHILELQSEIAKTHIDMENVGLQDLRGHGGPVGSENKAEAGNTRGQTGKSRGNESPEEREHDSETDEATEGEELDGDDEVFGKRKQEEEFTRLADRFAKRKVAIDSVMDKLDNLSIALKAFHALPTPELNLTSSRTDTMLSYASMTTAHDIGETSRGSAPFRPLVKPPFTTIIDDSQRADSPLDIHPTITH